jgi:protocatechuate 3,4-dioxygenase beta subunit
MMTGMDNEMSRRRLLVAGGAAAVAVVLGACARDGDPSDEAAPGTSTTSTLVAETPECVDGDDVEVTPSQTEGPYFTPNSPERSNIAEGQAGTPLVIAGTIVSTDCTPHAGALLDVWQADDAGDYDNSGYTLRGHQFADDEGRFRLETIVPGRYPGRTRHIHVKVQPKGGRVLTTQLYFPGEPQNATDSIYREECELAMSGESSASFQFVIA